MGEVPNPDGSQVNVRCGGEEGKEERYRGRSVGQGPLHSQTQASKTKDCYREIEKQREDNRKWMAQLLKLKLRVKSP